MALSLAYVLLLAVCGITFVQWGYGNSVYFSIITFTTVGLGDFAPRFSSEEGKASRYTKMLAMSIFVIVGLSLLAGLVGAVREEMSKQGLKRKLRFHLARKKKKGDASMPSLREGKKAVGGVEVQDNPMHQEGAALAIS